MHPSPTDSTWQFKALDPPDDHQAIDLSAFLREQSSDATSYPEEKVAYLRWKLTDNVVHPGFASLAVSTASGHCVSLCTVTPKRLWSSGQEVPWAEIGDTFTDEQFQRRGLFVTVVDASRRRAQEAGFGIIYGLPNDQSRPGYLKKLNFAIKPDVTLVRHLLPLSTRALSTRAFFDDRPISLRLLDGPVVRRTSALVVGNILRIRGLSPGVHTEESTSGFGSEFDELWKRARAHIPFAQVRDVKHLLWRFDRNPFSFKVLTARRRGTLVGYIILHIRESGAKRRFRHAAIVDWLYDREAGGGVARALLGGAIRCAVAARADLISAVATPATPLPLSFRSFGFVEESVDLPLIVHQNADGVSLLAARGAFHFTLSDTDTF